MSVKKCLLKMSVKKMSVKDVSPMFYQQFLKGFIFGNIDNFLLKRTTKTLTRDVFHKIVVKHLV